MDARRHRLPLSAFATALVASLAIAAPSAHAADCAGADQLPVLSTTASAKAATLCLLNQQRAANGLGSLAGEPTLEAAATAYAQAMIAGKFFDHVTPSGLTLEDRLTPYLRNARGYSIGENLAWGSGALATPRSIVEQWMQSSGHRENILRADFDQIGVGIVPGVPVNGVINAGATYVTEFGARQLAASPTQASAASLVLDVTPGAAKKKKAKKLSAKTKRRISSQCHAIARRTKGSAKTREARYERCVRTKTKAAQR